MVASMGEENSRKTVRMKGSHWKSRNELYNCVVNTATIKSEPESLVLIVSSEGNLELLVRIVSATGHRRTHALNKHMQCHGEWSRISS